MHSWRVQVCSPGRLRASSIRELRRSRHLHMGGPALCRRLSWSRPSPALTPMDPPSSNSSCTTPNYRCSTHCNSPRSHSMVPSTRSSSSRDPPVPMLGRAQLPCSRLRPPNGHRAGALNPRSSSWSACSCICCPLARKTRYTCHMSWTRPCR